VSFTPKEGIYDGNRMVILLRFGLIGVLLVTAQTSDHLFKEKESKWGINHQDGRKWQSNADSGKATFNVSWSVTQQEKPTPGPNISATKLSCRRLFHHHKMVWETS
jgi:hypothetical protein